MARDISSLEKKIVYLDQSAKKGGDGSAAHPYCDFTEAFEAAKEILRSLTAPTNVVLSVKGGDYSIADTLLLTGEDMPVPGSHFTVKGEGEVILSSLESVCACRFTASESNKSIYTVPLLRRDGIPKNFRYLYADGKMATLAKNGATRAADFATHRIRFEPSFDASGKCADPKAACKLYLAKDLVMPLVGDKTEGRVAVSAELHTVSEWHYYIMHIDAVDLDDVAVYSVEDPEKAFFIFKNEGVVAPEEHVAVYLRPEEYSRFGVPCGFPYRGRHHYLANALAFLDEEGEYYYDRMLGNLSYYTEGDIAAHTFALPRACRLISMENVDGVTFEGITFTGTDDIRLTEFGALSAQASCDGRFHDYPSAAAIYGNHCKNLTVRGCTFRELPCEGISLRGRVEDLIVCDSTFRNIGSSAIRSGGPTSVWGTTGGNLNLLIENNDLDNIATIYCASPAICMASTKDSKISHNTITNCSYSGMSIGWCWNSTTIPRGERVNIDNVEITDNYIAGFVTEMCDGGAIYTLGANDLRETPTLANFVRRNCVVYTNKTANGNGNLCCGIYFDGSSSHWLAQDNVIVEQSLGAWPGDEGAEDLPYTYRARLQERRGGSFYCYTQREPAPDYWVCWQNTYMLNSRGKDLEEERQMAHRGLLVEERHCWDENTVYVHGWDNVPAEAVAVIGTAGCEGRKCDFDELKKNRY